MLAVRICHVSMIWNMRRILLDANNCGVHAYLSINLIRMYRCSHELPNACARDKWTHGGRLCEHTNVCAASQRLKGIRLSGYACRTACLITHYRL